MYCTPYSSNCFKYPKKVWDDIRVPISAVKLGPTFPPDWITFNSGSLLALGFDDNRDEHIHFTAQFPHSYAEGTEIEAHIHWCPITTNGGNVAWELEYQWANFDEVFPSSTVVLQLDAADGVAWKHQHHDISFISGTGKKISSMLVCRLSRMAGTEAGDTHSGDAALLEIDFHFRGDAHGSVLEWVK